MNKNTIRLKQSDLNKIITETVARVLRERQEVVSREEYYKHEDDFRAIKSIMSIMNNFHHYVKIHLSGENTRKFNPNTITEFRKSLRENLSLISNQEAKSICTPIVSEICSINSKDFEGIMNALENGSDSIRKAYELIKDAYRDVWSQFSNNDFPYDFRTN